MSVYNEVGYTGYPFVQTHPDRLATMAALVGLDFAPVETCRVLEIGCGDGGNLIPMAVAYPQAMFTGFDLAATPIAAGNRIIDALGLKNISLRVADVMDVDAAGGLFDYIITHGLYSWVPAPVRDRILRISKENLSPEGIAFVSYNALPGSRIRQMLREMMLFQVREIEDPAERISQAKAMLRFVSTAQNRSLAEEIERIQNRESFALFHDELADVYEPVHFHQFMDHAVQHGLQFVAEAEFAELHEGRLAPETIATLDAIADDDRVLREQYIDFAIGRSFRQTLLCHEGREVDFPPKAERVAKLYVSAGPAQAKTTHRPMVNAIRKVADVSPEAVPVSDLKVDPEIILSAALAGALELHAGPVPLVRRPGPKPVTSPLIRYQIAESLPLTTLHHATLRIEDGVDLQLLALLDGTRAVGAISEIPDAAERVGRLAEFGAFISPPDKK